MIKYHFLNVGHGDTTVIELPNVKLMLVDFNRSNEFDEETAKELAEIYELDFKKIKEQKQYYQALSKYYDIPLDDPLAYLDYNFENKDIFRYIQTHPDIDHLSGFKSLTEKYEILNFWDTDHKNIKKTDFLNETDKEDWNSYLDFRKNNKKIFYRKHASISSKDGKYPYQIYVFHPTKEALESGDKKDNPEPNSFSYLLLIDYNGFKTVLGGDVPDIYWKDLWEWLENNNQAQKLFKGIHLLKASHHGRKSGRCGWEENGKFVRDFLDWMDPECVIISVGKKPKNCDATEWYRKRPNAESRTVLTTRWHGSIIASFEGDEYDKELVEIETKRDNKDTSEYIEKLEDHGIDWNLNPSYKLKIKGNIVYKGSKQSGRIELHIKSNGKPIEKGKNLLFEVNSDESTLPYDYQTKWRVVNRGEEARTSGDLPGKIESDDAKHQKQEHTKYKGSHYIDCFVIQDNTCIAWDRFYVNIK